MTMAKLFMLFSKLRHLTLQCILAYMMGRPDVRGFLNYIIVPVVTIKKSPNLASGGVTYACLLFKC